MQCNLYVELLSAIFAQLNLWLLCAWREKKQQRQEIIVEQINVFDIIFLKHLWAKGFYLREAINQNNQQMTERKMKCTCIERERVKHLAIPYFGVQYNTTT